MLKGFKLDLEAGTGTTGFFGHKVKINPKKLVELFGEGCEGDSYKVSREWIFVDCNDYTPFIIHDWKDTTLYWGFSEHDIFPSIEEFWGSDIVELSINHKDPKDVRVLLLKEQLEKLCN